MKPDQLSDLLFRLEGDGLQSRFHLFDEGTLILIRGEDEGFGNDTTLTERIDIEVGDEGAAHGIVAHVPKAAHDETVGEFLIIPSATILSLSDMAVQVIDFVEDDGSVVRFHPLSLLAAWDVDTEHGVADGLESGNLGKRERVEAEVLTEIPF